MPHKKHVRQTLRAWKKMGCEVRPIKRNSGHLHFEVTLPDGRVKRVPMAGSPSNCEHAVAGAIRQIQDAIDGNDKNL